MRRIILPVVAFGAMACGPVQQSGSDLKIVNGKPVEEGDVIAKSTVSLVTDNSSYCTGTLISPRFVLTAAHCLRAIPAEDTQVYFGLDARDSSSIKNEWLVDTESGMTHEAYSLEDADLDSDGYSKTAVNDIAIIELAADAPEHARPVPFLRDGEEVEAGEKLVLAGYGRTTNDDEESGILRKVETTLGGVLSTKEIEITRGDKNSCNGDSGGPAYVLRKGQITLLGVLSRGDLDCKVTGIYTDVRMYTKWVDKNREDMEKNQQQEPAEEPEAPADEEIDPEHVVSVPPHTI